MIRIAILGKTTAAGHIHRSRAGKCETSCGGSVFTLAKVHLVPLRSVGIECEANRDGGLLCREIDYQFRVGGWCGCRWNKQTAPKESERYLAIVTFWWGKSVII